MASSPDPSHTGSSDEARTHDQYLADVLAELTDKVCQGQVVDFHAICEQHPTLANDLKQLWGAVLVTDTAGTAYDEAPMVPDVPDIAEDSSSRWRSLRLPTTIGDFDLLEWAWFFVPAKDRWTVKSQSR